MSISETIVTRKSCRAYLDKPIEKDLIYRLLEVAKWAPSGVNHQPVQVAVLGSETIQKLSTLLIEKYTAQVPPNPDYDFCPKNWSDKYTERRKAAGSAMYNSLSIAIDDLHGKKQHREKNYSFFNAPNGLILYMDKNMPKGSWIDAGMFIQNVLLAAQDLGLSSCPQAAFAEYPDVVREVLQLHNVDIICGIALGFADTSHPINSYRTERQAVDHFSKWYA